MTFANVDEGTPEDDWAAADLPATLPTLLLHEVKRLVVVAAHPDDETLGAGGLLSRAAQLGLPIVVVVLSSGEASHPDSTTHTGPQLAQLRETELTDALTALAPSADLRLIRLPDGDLSDHLEEATRAITHAIDGGGPGTWVIAPWRSDGHPDHTAAGEAAAAAVANASARLLEYPIWAWFWSTPGSDVWAGVWPGVWPQGATISVLRLSTAERQKKGQALAGFPSQTRELSAQPGDELLLPAAFLDYFRRGYETFIETSVAAAGTELATARTAPEPEESSEVQPAPAGSIPTLATAGTADPVGDTRAVSALHGATAENRSLTEPFFDDLYAGTRDPWGFESRWYERRKRALTLAALPRARFGSVLELGCSIGVFTEQLTTRADSVIAVDISEEPLRIARERLAGHPEVVFERLTVPREWPEGPFDLIVLSEVGYYCSTADLRRLLERCRSSLAADGVLLACHWRHPVEVYPLSGDAVHAQLARVAGLQRTVHHVEYDFLLEVFEPRPARSVAQREGMVS